MDREAWRAAVHGVTVDWATEQQPQYGDGLGVNVDPCAWSSDARELSGLPRYPDPRSRGKPSRQEATVQSRRRPASESQTWASTPFLPFTSCGTFAI